MVVKCRLLGLFLLLMSTNITFAQCGMGISGLNRCARKMGVSSTNNIFNFKNSISFQNNVDFIAYFPLFFPDIYPGRKEVRTNFGLGLGVITYDAYNLKYPFYVKANYFVYLRRYKKIYTEISFDYLFNNTFNTGLYLKKGFNLFKKKLQYNFNIFIGGTYLSAYKDIAYSIGVGINSMEVLYMKKPILYFYSKDTLDVEVKLNLNGALTFSWPKYNDKWDITVYPNSEILNKVDQKRYNYLYWEGRYPKPDENTIETGFIVPKDRLAEFLLEKLEFIGLNEKEINDFITYWVPMLTENKYLIHFIQNEECNIVAKYLFSKNPQTFIRLMVLFVATEKENIKAQDLIQNKRSGFTVVEWGGSVY